MSYNLLLNTSFQTNDNWKFINCEYKNGYLISNNKVFGIEQDLILPDPTKLYFRWNYKVCNSIKEVKIGIQNKDILNINKKVPKVNRKQSISVIDVAKQESIKLHLIFESNTVENKVYIDSPILVDLVWLNKSTWLKSFLDRSIFFMNGYSYRNLYASELKKDLLDFKPFNLEEAKIGSIVNSFDTIQIPLTVPLITNNYYLVKLDYKEINKFGNIRIEYGLLKSTYIGDEQLYLIFKANNNSLNIVIEPNDIISYKVNLKHILLIDITKMKLLKEDIGNLSFI